MLTAQQMLVDAASKGSLTGVVSALAAGADINRSAHGETGWRPLHHACWQGKAEMVALLLETGADPNARIEPTVNDRAIVTPLDAAVFGNVMSEATTRIVQGLVGKGARASHKQLIHAARKERPDIVGPLIEGGAWPLRAKDGAPLEDMCLDRCERESIRTLRLAAERKIAQRKLRETQTGIEM